jgi:hypothetical protein
VINSTLTRERNNEMSASVEFDPVFVHATARGGSTYFFNVLRRNESLMCFNEAIDDAKRDLPWFREFRQRKIAHSGKAHNWNVNHFFLDRDDNEEFYEAWDVVMHLCPTDVEMGDFFTQHGKLQDDLLEYLAALMKFARSRGRRPVLCEVASRGRAGALRGAFGGFHIAQYRDPISQFGSYLRALIEGRTWDFLVGPVVELNTSSGHPLIKLVPETWRAPVLTWRTESRAQFWASRMRYHAALASPLPQAVANLFCWHMFTWILGNLAAVSYSDLALDIDKVHDDEDYRASTSNALARKIGGVSIHFNDIRRFDRYYEFDSFDVSSVCDQVVSAIQSALADGRLEAALCLLAQQPPVTPPASAVELLVGKIRDSMAAMATSRNRTRISHEEWKDIVSKNRRIWFRPGFRQLARMIHPLAFPLIRAARLRGVKI